MTGRERDLAALSGNRDLLRSKAGGFLGGKAVFKGLSGTDDMAGSMGVAEAALLGLLDRRPSRKELDLYEILVCVNVYPDARIWCMGAGAYAAAAGSPYSAAYAASVMALHSMILGMRPVELCASFAQVSFNVIVRLNTNFPGWLSLSSAKYAKRSNW